MNFPSSKTSPDAMSGMRQNSDDVAQSTERAANASRAYANDALDKAESKVRELRGSVDPMVDMLATKAQKLARQSMDMAAEAKDRAQQSLGRAADVTQRYVSEQPVRSVLIAAAVGAGIALLVSMALSKGDRDSY
ncbi:MAG: hypothetical protein JWP47_1250 [Polaromonas sp.]|jgi:ElaB/YqjD/DUF883 family membrane-anchored ribosome-binding protein|nr:hypothetical protein [Polaromonas sp.]